VYLNPLWTFKVNRMNLVIPINRPGSKIIHVSGAVHKGFCKGPQIHQSCMLSPMSGVQRPLATQLGASIKLVIHSTTFNISCILRNERLLLLYKTFVY
jgi:hypothetical protein